MVGMDRRRGDWMKGRARISEEDMKMNDQETNELHSEFPHDYLLQKVGDPRPFIGTGGVPSLLFFSSASLLFFSRGRVAFPLETRAWNITETQRQITPPSPLY